MNDKSGSMARDPASDQLPKYKESVKEVPTLLTGNGAPIADTRNILTVGPRGPQLMQDFVFLDEIQHFNRERVPERVVHAKGAGAHGYFEVTHDISKYSKAKVFQGIGKKTPIFVRFSTTAGESGSADTIRDTRGFAVKFYTEEGIWDLVGNNSSVFFVKDPFLFMNLIHAQKRNPVTHLRNADMIWDFFSLRPESTHQVMISFSDRGIPDGYRHMHGHGINTFKLINAKNQMVYCKFHYKTDQGIKNLSVDKAASLASSDPDYSTRDLYNAIASGNYPSWSFYIQVMTPQQAKEFRWNPFDVTKVWPQKEYPFIPVGKLVLNKNPENYFAEVEQVTFNPANLVSGIEPSPDKLLQGRLFAYGDTHKYRVGVNHFQLPINCPYSIMSTTNYQRDGFMAYNNQGGAPNYFPNSFSGPQECPAVRPPSFHESGDVDRHDPVNEDNFSQATALWRNVLKEDERTRLVENIVSNLKNASEAIIKRTVENFGKVDADFQQRLTDGLRKAGAQIGTLGRTAHL